MPNFFWELSMGFEGQSYAQFSSRLFGPFKRYWFRAKVCPFFLRASYGPNYVFFFEGSLMGHAQGYTMSNFPHDDVWPFSTIDLGQNDARFFWEPAMGSEGQNDAPVYFFLRARYGLWRAKWCPSFFWELSMCSEGQSMPNCFWNYLHHCTTCIEIWLYNAI